MRVGFDKGTDHDVYDFCMEGVKEIGESDSPASYAPDSVLTAHVD
jgi:hypothetical protein